MQILLATGLVSEDKSKLHLSLSLMASRQRDNGIELLGGVCLGAKVVTCNFIIEAMDDVTLQGRVDRSTGLYSFSEGLNASSGVPKEKTVATSFTDQMVAANLSIEADKPNWADEVMASVRAAADRVEENKKDSGPEVEDEPYRAIQLGDIMEHQQFGRCVVQKVDADQEFVTVRLRNSRLVRLNLEVLRLRYHGQEEGHQVFVTSPGLAASE